MISMSQCSLPYKHPLCSLLRHPGPHSISTYKTLIIFHLISHIEYSPRLHTSNNTKSIQLISHSSTMPSAFGFAAYLTQDLEIDEKTVLNDLREYLLKEGLSNQEIYDVSTRGTQIPVIVPSCPLYYQQWVSTDFRPGSASLHRWSSILLRSYATSYKHASPDHCPRCSKRDRISNSIQWILLHCHWH